MMMLGKPLTAEQRLQKAVIDITAKDRYRALTGVLMIGEKRVSDNEAECPTAYTDGKNEVYGRAFVDSLNDAELRFLVLHEVKHKMYKHLTTWQHLWREDAQLTNQACDFVINAEIVDENKDGFATMTGELTKGCYDAKYLGWDSARVFYDLKNNPPQGNGGSGSGSGSGSGKGFDQHGWEHAKEMTAEEQRDLSRAIDEALRQGALVAGKTGGGKDRALEALLTPQVNWRDALREFVTSTCTGSDYSTWRKPNRRYIGAGIYMPSGITEQIGEIIIAPDMSGSTLTPRMMCAIMSEVIGIAETVHPEAIRILYWDTEVRRDERYEAHETQNIVQSTKPAGGGGTTVECVPAYIAEKQIKAQAVIVLTDGYLGGSWGNWHTPILWCVLDNENANPPVGKTVRIKSYDM